MHFKTRVDAIWGPKVNIVRWKKMFGQNPYVLFESVGIYRDRTMKGEPEPFLTGSHVPQTTLNYS